MTFHGAFVRKADAIRKERRVHGFIQPRTIRGQRRYVVMTENVTIIRRCPRCGRLKCPHPERYPLAANPGILSSMWKGAKSGYHSYRASRYEEKAARHRKKAQGNPRRRMIPGTAVQIRYRRSGAQRGMYYHDFKPGVRMVANADGSVTLRGPRKIHAVDTEPGFWQRYGHGKERGMRNARRRRSSGGGMDMSTLLLLAVGGYVVYRYFGDQASAGSFAPTSQASADAMAAYRAGEQGDTLTSAAALAAQRAGEWATAVLDPMAGAEEVPVDWSVMPQWDWGSGGLH